MKKLIYLSILGFATFLSSSTPTATRELEIGKQAPALTLKADCRKEIDSIKEKYVLINFWSATDAASRIANHSYSNLAEWNGHEIEVVSVCIDDDYSLAGEIMAADKISDNVISLSKKDLTADVLKNYQTDTGCRAFVIDPYGNLASIL